MQQDRWQVHQGFFRFSVFCNVFLLLLLCTTYISSTTVRWRIPVCYYQKSMDILWKVLLDLTSVITCAQLYHSQSWNKQIYMNKDFEILCGNLTYLNVLRQIYNNHERNRDANEFISSQMPGKSIGRSFFLEKLWISNIYKFLNVLYITKVIKIWNKDTCENTQVSVFFSKKSNVLYASC